MSNSPEIWKFIGHYAQYQVSTKGNVRNMFRKGKLLKQKTRQNGYKEVSLSNGTKGNKSSYSVHRLVAKAFIPNPCHKPYVNHIDHDKTNNCVENLEWVTAKENNQHDVITGWYEGHASHRQRDNKGKFV